MEQRTLQTQYEDTLNYLYASLPVFQRASATVCKGGMDKVVSLLTLAGNPHFKFKKILVTGTNGKSSVSNCLASVLQQRGLKVGLYTSPHLHDFRERIRINGEKIPSQYIIDFVKKNRKEFDRIKPSFFEMTITLAFKYFAEKNVDIVIIGARMGGHLELANIIQPEISVITNINLDQTQPLDDCLLKIAFKKSGIIRSEIPVIIGETQHEVSSVFIKKANSLKSPIVFADKNYAIQNMVDNELFFTFDVYKNRKLFSSGIQTPLKGLHQQKNLITAFQAIEELNRKGYAISSEHIKDGLKNIVKNTGFAGWWQVLQRKPLVICDTGHNESNLSFIIEQIKKVPHEHLHFILSMVNDKDISEILKQLPCDATYYFCEPSTPRGLDAKILQQKALEKSLKGNVYSSANSALQAAKQNASSNDLIFIGTSSFVADKVAITKL